MLQSDLHLCCLHYFHLTLDGAVRPVKHVGLVIFTTQKVRTLHGKLLKTQNKKITLSCRITSRK